MSVQTTISADLSRGFEGSMIQPGVVLTRRNSEASKVPFGRVIVQAADDEEFALPGSASFAAFGVLLRTDAYELYNQSGDAGVDADELGNIMLSGVCLLKVEDAVQAGGQVFVRHTAGATLNEPGRVRSNDGNEGSGALAEAEPGLVYLEDGSAGDLVRVAVNLPQTAS